MPKFTAEIDSDNKTQKFFLDGNEVSLHEFGIGCYKHEDHCCDDSGINITKEVTSCYVSMTTKEGDNKYSYSLSYNDKDDSMSESRTVYVSTAREIGKIIERVIASAKLSEALNKVRLEKK